MELAMNAEYDGELGAPVQDVAQEAIDAVAVTYSNDSGIDVEEQLRAQLSGRGIRSADDSWVADVARQIRSGHDVQVGRSDGSMGDS